MRNWFRDILAGMGSILNLSGRDTPSLDRTDAEALAGDWQAVGREIEKTTGIKGIARSGDDLAAGRVISKEAADRLLGW